MLQVLLLAAGHSRRFGDNKLLQQVDAQRTVLDVSYHAAACLHTNPLLVINDDASMRAHCEQHGYTCLINQQASEGMASSIVCGVAATPGADGWAICLADMPCIRHETMQQLYACWTGDRILVPRYQKQAGHPVIFPGRYFSQLTSLQGDQGARRIVQESQEVSWLDVDDPGILLDIDTRAELSQCIEALTGD